MSEPSVVNALRRLVALEADYQEALEDARNQLRTSRGQVPSSCLVVGVADIDRALRLYENRQLSSEQLQEWAEFLEMNDYVEYERSAEGVIAELLFAISSPEVHEPITRSVVRRMRDSLRRSSSGKSS